MSRVIFVDDEQPVLDGIQNLLRKHRRRWDMEFALGADAALEAIEAAPPDVLVSDMRMPGVDGAALLAKVKAEHPRTVRVVLSGHAGRDALLRVLPVAHQFLGKPCDATALERLLERTFALSSLLHDERVRTLAGNENILPSPPAIYGELNALLADEKAGVNEIAAIVERDPAMCLRVLQLVNSAYFGLSQRVTSVDRAVSYLGLEAIRGLALTAHVFSSLANGAARDLIAQVQNEALTAARLARRFVSRPQLVEEAFTSALLHDLGKLVLAHALPEPARAFYGGGLHGRELAAAEIAAFGGTHGSVGAYVVGMWGLPLSIVEAIEHHHQPGAAGQGEWEVLAAVHVAEALASDPEQPGDLDLEFLERVGVADRLPEWIALARRLRVERA